jgi:hypothetical protein
MSFLSVLALSAALATTAPEVRVVKVESQPLLIPPGQSKAALADDSLSMAENPILIEVRAARRPDGSLSIDCDGGNGGPSHDFRRGLPQ